MPRHRVLVPLRWSDMDAYGHVNNVEFLRLLEEARVAAFADWATPGEASLLDGGVIVARAEIEYLTPLVHRIAPIAADVWVTSIGGASFDLGYELSDDASPGDGRHPGPAVYARAVTRMVSYDLAARRPRRLTRRERDVLAARCDGGSPLGGRREAGR